LEEEPVWSYGQQYFTLAGVTITAGEDASYVLGYCLRVEGVVVFARRYGRAALVLYNPKIALWERPRMERKVAAQFKRWAWQMREKAAEVYRGVLPEPEAGLLSGIVLGAKSQLPSDFSQQLKVAGVLHVVVASGYNLTVVSQAPVEELAWFLGRRGAIVLGSVLIWLYVLITGGEPPIVRAGLMISMVYLAQFLGKKFDALRVFLWTVWAMLMVSPGLLESISFQLSAAAMGGMLLFNNNWQRLRKFKVVGNSLADSLSCQIAVAPIIAYHFSQISWAAPLTNMVLLPLVPGLMGIGLLGLMGLIWRPIAIPILYFVYPSLCLFVRLVEKIGEISWLMVGVKFEGWMAIIYYLGVGAVLLLSKKQLKIKNFK